MPSFEYPHGRIARLVEDTAGREFGPKRLGKERLAPTFNVSPDQITEEEWAEIYEFSVNAGSDLIRSAIKTDVPDAIASNDIYPLQMRILANDDGLIPRHDIFHAAETYRLTKGASASAEFITKTDKRSRYTDPGSAAAELYPVLFLVLDDSGAPLPVLLSTIEGRKKIADSLAPRLDPGLSQTQELLKNLNERTAPELPSARQQEYELLLELIVISQAIKALQDMDPAVEPLTAQEQEAVHKAIQEASQIPDSHYKNFAEKVFSQTDFTSNPRLFLDEFLISIRSFHY